MIILKTSNSSLKRQTKHRVLSPGSIFSHYSQLPGCHRASFRHHLWEERMWVLQEKEGLIKLLQSSIAHHLHAWIYYYVRIIMTSTTESYINVLYVCMHLHVNKSCIKSYKRLSGKVGVKQRKKKKVMSDYSPLKRGPGTHCCVWVDSIEDLRWAWPNHNNWFIILYGFFRQRLWCSGEEVIYK